MGLGQHALIDFATMMGCDTTKHLAGNRSLPKTLENLNENFIKWNAKIAANSSLADQVEAAREFYHSARNSSDFIECSSVDDAIRQTLQLKSQDPTDVKVLSPFSSETQEQKVKKFSSKQYTRPLKLGIFALSLKDDGRDMIWNRPYYNPETSEVSDSEFDFNRHLPFAPPPDLHKAVTLLYLLESQSRHGSSETSFEPNVHHSWFETLEFIHSESPLLYQLCLYIQGSEEETRALHHRLIDIVLLALVSVFPTCEARIDLPVIQLPLNFDRASIYLSTLGTYCDWLAYLGFSDISGFLSIVNTQFLSFLLSLPEINDYQDNENVESAVECVWNLLRLVVESRQFHPHCRTLLEFVVRFAFADVQCPAVALSHLPPVVIQQFHSGFQRIKNGETRRLLQAAEAVKERIKNQSIIHCKHVISASNTTIPHHVAVKCCDLLFLHYKVDLSQCFDGIEMEFLRRLYQKRELNGEYRTIKRFFKRHYTRK
ncbi:hypothetical protein GEMRC1_006175 [Eukaryota sp. GEM-RC1]